MFSKLYIKFKNRNNPTWIKAEIQRLKEFSDISIGIGEIPAIGASKYFLETLLHIQRKADAEIERLEKRLAKIQK